ncbi:MAG: HD-GYP domain-containing protein [Christensenellaceae bacterium]
MIFIPMSKITRGMKLPENVLVFNSSNVLLLNKNTVVTDQLLERLYNFQVPGVYIQDELSGDLVPSKPILTTKVKAQTLNNIEWLFNDSVEDKVSSKQKQRRIRQIDKTVSNLVDLIKKNDTILVNISDLKSYDDYTYHHSLSVAIIALAIGVQLKLTETELKRLGFCAVMHDIGKMKVPIELINKPGRLTGMEFGVVKKHAEYSGEYLIENEIKDPEIYNAVICHHEHFDGSGYPYGLFEKEIPIYSKIISVSDVYDAITSNRSYRDPALPSEAAEYLMANCGNVFDIDIVRAFMEKIEFFPLGSFVELSNGSKAIVIENSAPLRPTVRLLERPNTVIDLFSDRRYLNVTITQLFNDIPMADINALSKKNSGLGKPILTSPSSTA